ncbi:MAG: DUF11 domain-containing protein [Rugosibacter sp.]|nr:DUF11 domain-containing protein [Rugosibacter sp.]
MLFLPGIALAGVDLVVNHTDTPDPVPAGGVVSYTVRVTNNSFDTTATGVATTYSVPATVTYQGFSGAGVACTGMSIGASGPGVLNCTLPNLAANGGQAIFTVQLKTSAQGSITASATATSIEPDDQPLDNTNIQESTTVNAGADLVMGKTPAVASAASGSSFSWALSLTNNGPDAATSLVVQDPVPAGFNVTGLPAGCSNVASTITCNIAGPVASGATLSLGNVTGTVFASGGSTVTNTASVLVSPTAPFGTPQDPDTSNNTAIANLSVTAGSDLAISKARSVGGSVLVGSTFNFVLTPSYTGDVPNGLTVSDTIPANYTIGAVAVSQNGWTCGVVGQVVTCTKPAGGVAGLNQALGTITIPVTVASAGTPVNSATISSSSPGDPNPANNMATDGGATLLDPTVDLGLSKTGPNPPLVVLGVPFNYSMAASNSGTTAYFGDLRITDNLPLGLTVNGYTLNGWSCSPAAPVIGPAAITCDRTYTAGSPLAVGATTPAVILNVTSITTGAINNTATVTAITCNLGAGNCGDGDTSSYPVTSSIGPDAADIRLLKTVDLVNVPAGDVLTYTLEIVNAGPQTSTTVVLTDTFDTLINSSVGLTGAGYLDETLTLGSATGGSCSNAAAGGNGRSLTCTFAAIPVCTAGIDCPKVVVRVRPGGDGGSRTNNANAVSNGTADPDHVNDNASATNTVLARADVTVSKIATPDPVAAGQNLAYVITASNAGPSRADTVSITDTLPLDVTFVSASPSAGSCATTPGSNVTTTGLNRTVACALGNINNGSQQTVTIIVRPNTVTRGTTLANNVAVATTTTETNAGNNTGVANATVSNPALDLVINKADSVDPVAVGDNTVYTITITNSGPSAAENVVVTDTLPASALSFQSVTSSAGSCPTQPAVNAVGGSVVCNLGYIATGATRTITLTMQGVAKGVVINSATVASDETALGFEVAGNNTAPQQTTIRTKADVQVVSKTPSVNPVNLRDNFNFVVKVRNNVGLGLAEADGVVVSDTLPAGMELTGTPSVVVLLGTTTSTTCTGVAGGTSFTCTLGTVSSGGEVDITVPVQLVSVTSMPQTFTNTASVSTSSFDQIPANNSNNGAVTVNASSLAGRVFRDFNNDGVVTAGDTGITGISITLSGTSFDGAPISRTVTTDASGNYSFANLPQGTYTVTEGAVAETNLNDGIDTAGTASGNTAVNDIVSAIALPANTAATGYTFAEVPQARVAIAKAVTSGPTANPDGTFNVTFQLVVRNPSLEALNNVTVTDQLAGASPLFGTFNAGVLGDGEYKIASAPSGTCAGAQAGFNGSGVTTAAITPTLAAGASCTISFALQVKPTAPLPPLLPSGGRYENQAVVDAVGALSGQTSATNPQLRDLSDNGANPDANGNGRGNEAGENDPTPVAPTFAAAIGIAKQVNGNVSVAADGSLIVPIRLVVTNIGNESLNAVSVTDPLSTAAGGQFGTFVVGGASAVLTNGQYAVSSAPTFSGACTNGSVVAGFTGHTGNLAVANITNMATAASCTIDFTYRFKPTTATTYTNQAQAAGTGALTATPVNDVSDNGSNPDPNANGNAGEPGENDPTPVPVPRIGVAKSAGSITRNGDGTYSVPFTLTIRNMGETPLTGVQLNDTIAGALPQFGSYTASAIPAAGQYTISSGPTVASQTNGAVITTVAAGIFTGSGGGNALLVAGASSLPNFGGAASTAQITFSIRFFPTTAGPFNNSAVAAGSPPGGGSVTDNSVDGANPDPNGNGDPTDDTSPTIVDITQQFIGVAKTVGAVVQTGAKRFRIPYTLIVANPSTTVTATNVQVTDNLTATFPTAQAISIATPAVVSACTGTVLGIAAPAFTGIGQNNLLAGNQNLQPGEGCTISFTTEVDFGGNPLPSAVQNNQAVATTAQAPGGTVIATDLSNNGNIVDPNSNGDANEPSENIPTPVNFSAAGLSAVSGTVYLDANHDRSNNDPLASSSVLGFIVEVLNANGVVVGTATTDANGNYTVAGLFPSTAGNPATYYSVRFREPVSGAVYGIPQSADPSPARNGTIDNGLITSLQLTTGVTTLAQNLPLDPSGVVYDSVTRNPIAGAQVTLTNGGAPVPLSCLVGGINTQVTGANGYYQYLLINPVPPGCPGSGVYTLQVVQPGGYLPPDSILIPPTAGPHAPVPLGGVDAVQAQPVPPTGAQPTTYFTSFTLTITGNPATSSAQLVNNHIPIDPILGGAIVVTKTTPLINVTRGDLVPYTVTATNTLAATLANIDVRDRIPPGFRYRNGSTTLNGVPLEPTVNGRDLIWPNQTFAPNEKKTWKLILVVGAGVGEGEYVNQAWATNNIVNAAVSNIANATVRIVPDPTFDCSDIIGKVFDDKNANGYQDEGEPGIPNVRVVTARGLLVTTDAEGRFHVACAAIPQADRGSNFVMKLDTRTLPTGYRVTTENPRDVRVTRGKLVKLNFGATVHRVVRLEVSDEAFTNDDGGLNAKWQAQIEPMMNKLAERPSVLRIAYRTGAKPAASQQAQQRLDGLAKQFRERWKAREKSRDGKAEDKTHYPLVIEAELEGAK